MGGASTQSAPDAAAANGAKRHRVDRVIPGVGMLRSYKKQWLRFDLVAGIVLAAILVPQGLAYAELAGLPPVTGLYTTIACLVVYALLGPSPRSSSSARTPRSHPSSSRPSSR